VRNRPVAQGPGTKKALTSREGQRWEKMGPAPGEQIAAWGGDLKKEQESLATHVTVGDFPCSAAPEQSPRSATKRKGKEFLEHQ